MTTEREERLKEALVMARGALSAKAGVWIGKHNLMEQIDAALAAEPRQETAPASADGGAPLRPSTPPPFKHQAGEHGAAHGTSVEGPRFIVEGFCGGDYAGVYDRKQVDVSEYTEHNGFTREQLERIAAELNARYSP